MVVGAMYRPPASSIPGALELIDQQLRDAVSTGKPVIIVGDLNINLLQPTGPGVQVSRISVVGLSYLAKFSSSVAVSR